MIGTLFVDDGNNPGVRRVALVAALLVPLVLLVAVSAGSIVRGAEARQLVLAETYRQVAELVADHLSHRLVDSEEYLVAELAAGSPDIDELAQRIGAWEQQQPGLRPMALVGTGGELLQPLSEEDGDLEAVILQLPNQPSAAATRVAPVVLSREETAAATSAARPRRGDRRSKARRWAFDQRLETVQCQLDSKQYAGAADTALGALRYLIENRFHLGEQNFEDGLARTQALLEAIPLGPRARAELDDLRQEAARLDGVEEALQSLVASLQQVPELAISFERPRIDFVAVPLTSGDAPRAHPASHRRRGETPQPAWAIAEMPGTSIRLVHRLDFGSFDDVVSEALDDTGPLSDAGIAVVDASGRLVAGNVEAVPQDASLVPLRTVDGFQVAAFPRSGSLAEVARQDLLRNGALLLGAVAALAVGGTLGFRGLRRDIAASRMRTDFVSSVSHELKTPLALLSASAENLRSGWVPDDRKVEYYDTMMSEAQRLSHLVDNVLDFRRMEAGARSFSFEPADLRDVVDDTLGLYRMPATSAGIELEVDYPDAPVIADVDRESIRQVIANLVSNAMKYSTGPAPTVRLRLGESDEAVRIEVTDDGIGMSATDVEKACEPFYRGAASATVAGSGIGLSIVRHVVNAHGGSLDVDSVPGFGTTVTVRLPRRNDRPDADA